MSKRNIKNCILVGQASHENLQLLKYTYMLKAQINILELYSNISGDKGKYLSESMDTKKTLKKLQMIFLKKNSRIKYWNIELQRC